ncbi:hypothetical protein FS837_010249 [Tulasnella sp. UAMH 9824]|nr:hypothetical protein FS837_010249 [Tulasnella sp. UAMH 9824]
MRSFVTVILALSASMLASAASAPKKLVIERTYVPESCPTTTKTGDILRMSYVGTLFYGGREFGAA